MSNENWIEYKKLIKDRLREFSLKILELSSMLPNTIKGKVVNYQVTKSGTSSYANYRASLRGRSKAEFFSKLSITVEEMDETEMWLDLIIVSGILTNEFVKNLHKESIELIKILSSMRKRLS